MQSWQISYQALSLIKQLMLSSCKYAQSIRGKQQNFTDNSNCPKPQLSYASAVVSAGNSRNCIRRQSLKQKTCHDLLLPTTSYNIYVAVATFSARLDKANLITVVCLRQLFDKSLNFCKKFKRSLAFFVSSHEPADVIVSFFACFIYFSIFKECLKKPYRTLTCLFRSILVHFKHKMIHSRSKQISHLQPPQLP